MILINIDMMKYITGKLANLRLLHHIIFWCLSFIVLVNHFKVSVEPEKTDFLYTAIFQATLMIAVYFNLFFLIPGLLNKKQYIPFIISEILLITLASMFNILVFTYVIDYLLPDYYFISYYTLKDISTFFIIFISVTTLLKLSKSWFKLTEAKQKLSKLAQEKAEIELKALRAQVNPHFLFNSLNVLYSLALKKSSDLPDLIIKLSDILRYVIYDSNKAYVMLRAEIKLINDYLSLQKFRIDSNSRVNFSLNIKDDTIPIAPMLFLPLVENSFKHGIKGEINETYINIKLTSDENEILFEIENNKGSSDNIETENSSGIGLSNIKNRLKLIYSGNYSFDVDVTNELFKIKLIIKNENQLYYR